MSVVLVTGASGFIGRYVCKELERLEHNVIPFDGDIFSVNLDKYLATVKPNYLVNLAWVTGSGYSDSYKNLLFVSKGIELYNAFYQNGGKRAVFIGTEQEYARIGKFKFTEISKIEPLSLYAKCKAHLGDILLEDSKIRNNSFVWGRVFFVYGAGEKSERLMPSLISSLNKGEKIICSCNEYVRDYIYVKDLAGAVCHLLFSNYNGAVNLSGGCETTIGKIAETLQKIIGRGAVEFKSDEESGKQPPYICGDISLLNSLGWRHKYSLEAGLKEEAHEIEKAT